jgi:hypothetical protein
VLATRTFGQCMVGRTDERHVNEQLGLPDS